MSTWTVDYISPAVAPTLPALFLERLRRTPNTVAYRYFDVDMNAWQDITWAQTDQRIRHWQAGLQKENLKPGDCVALMMGNCPEWAIAEQAALRLGLVVVPLYPNDRAENLVHIINQTQTKLVVHYSIEQWRTLVEAKPRFERAPKLVHVLDVETKTRDEYHSVHFRNWLSGVTPEQSDTSQVGRLDPHALATIVYTSGTLGLPKGVMLSHDNIVRDAYYGIHAVTVYCEDLFLSFLPLSHTLERTVGYYIPMMCGSTVAFARSIPQLAEDLVTIKPTVLISVPRIFERVYAKIQSQMTHKSAIAKFLFRSAVSVGWRKFEAEQGRGSISIGRVFWPVLNALVAKKITQKLGGRIRFAICGGAPLSPSIAETFIGLGVKILQGYGLTEASPVISVNRIDKNIPASIGPALPNIQVRIAPDGELQTKSECVMLGYWKNEALSKNSFTPDGWLMTGDLAEIRGEHIFITGRKKEILVMSNGEKVPPVDIEMAIAMDPMFEQVMVIGEGRPYLSAVAVLNGELWKSYAEAHGVDPNNPDSLRNATVIDQLLSRARLRMAQFPGYAQLRAITLSTEVWSDANGMLTASLKLRRPTVMEKFKREIDKMYTGH